MKLIRAILNIAAVVALTMSAVASPIDVNAFGAGATVIDFNNLTGGNCLGCGTQVTDQYSLLGLIFDNPSYPGQSTAQTDLTYGVPNADGNILWVRQGGSIGDPPAEPFRLLFSAGVVRIGFNYASTTDAFLLLQAFSGDQPIGSAAYTGSPTAIGWGGFAGLQLPIPITRLDVSYRPFSDPSRTLNFSIDNVRFETAPEPSSLVLGILGLAGIALKATSLRG